MLDVKNVNGNPNEWRPFSLLKLALFGCVMRILPKLDVIPRVPIYIVLYTWASCNNYPYSFSTEDKPLDCRLKKASRLVGYVLHVLNVFHQGKCSSFDAEITALGLPPIPITFLWD